MQNLVRLRDSFLCQYGSIALIKRAEIMRIPTMQFLTWAGRMNRAESRGRAPDWQFMTGSKKAASHTPTIKPARGPKWVQGSTKTGRNTFRPTRMVCGPTTYLRSRNADDGLAIAIKFQN